MVLSSPETLPYGPVSFDQPSGSSPGKTSADAKTRGAFILPHYLPARNLLILVYSVSEVYAGFRVLKHYSFLGMNEVKACDGIMFIGQSVAMFRGEENCGDR